MKIYCLGIRNLGVTKKNLGFILQVRASIRTFNPRQIKYEDKSDIKFKHAVFMRNLNRIKAATAGFDPEVAIAELK